MGLFPWTGSVYNGLLPGAVPTAGPPSGQVGTFVLEAVKPAGRVMLFRWKKVGELGKGVLEQVPGLVDLGSTGASVCVCARACMCTLTCGCTQSCPGLGDPVDYSPPSSSVHGILQARELEWIAIPSSRGSSRPRDQACIFCLGRWVLYL